MSSIFIHVLFYGFEGGKFEYELRQLLEGVNQMLILILLDFLTINVVDYKGEDGGLNLAHLVGGVLLARVLVQPAQASA